MRSKKDEHHIDPYSDPKDPADVAVKSGGVEAWRQHDVHTKRSSENSIWLTIEKKNEHDYKHLLSFPEQDLEDVKAALNQITPDMPQRRADWVAWQGDWHAYWVTFLIEFKPFEWWLYATSDLLRRKDHKMTHANLCIGPFRFYASF